MKTLARFALTTALTFVFTGLTTYSATAEHPPCTLLGTVGTPEAVSDQSSAGLDLLPPADIALPPDGLRQLPQRRGITDQPRHLDGTVEVPAEIMNTLADQPEPIRHFIDEQLSGRRFTDTDVTVTAQSLTVAGLGSVLSRAG
ncbi:hypothetical protein [Nocardia sp. NPDC052112]|uniref:hypothetical protein n=1 Tax=Nocardia sp. NPDC052112 TaxID=3155646 RepID=UPI003423F18F